MRRSIRIAGAWLVVAIGGFVGIGGALVARLWISPGWAASVGGALAAVSATVAAIAGKSIEGHRNARRGIHDDIDLHGSHGGFPCVHEARDLVAVGVHPAEAHLDRPEQVPGMPRYIARDFDKELRSAVDEGGVVLLVGESTAGKSRAAFESLLARSPRHYLVVPSRRDSLTRIAEELSTVRRWVLWLDDLERYLGGDGLNPGLVDRFMPRTSPDRVVMCTMRASEYERFTNRAEPDTNADDQAAWRASRGVLRRARVVFADRLWSAAELARAAQHTDDARIVRALDHATTFGVAETLTAGPVLVRDWRNAWSPGAHPRGAALVTAAVDCRRAGLDVPVTRRLVEELHEHYLTTRGGHALRPEDLAEAWRWALQPVHGASSLILPAGPSGEEQRFIAFDYLLDLPDNAPVPSETWRALIARVEPEQVVHIAAEAYWRVRVSFHAAVESGAVTGVFPQASAAADKGDFARAIELLRTEQNRMTAEHPDVVRSLRHQIAFYHLRSGDAETAEDEFVMLLAEAEAELAADDEYLQVVRHNIASCRRRRGDFESALTMFRRILVDRDRYLGPQAMNTLDTRRAIAMLVARTGDLSAATTQLRALLADEVRALGGDHTNTLETRGALVQVLADAGKIDEAFTLSHLLLPDLVRALGTDHPDVREARRRHTGLVQRAGDVDAPQTLRPTGEQPPSNGPADR